MTRTLLLLLLLLLLLSAGCADSLTTDEGLRYGEARRMISFDPQPVANVMWLEEACYDELAAAVDIEGLERASRTADLDGDGVRDFVTTGPQTVELRRGEPTPDDVRSLEPAEGWARVLWIARCDLTPAPGDAELIGELRVANRRIDDVRLGQWPGEDMVGESLGVLGQRLTHLCVPREPVLGAEGYDCTVTELPPEGHDCAADAGRVPLGDGTCLLDVVWTAPSTGDLGCDHAIAIPADVVPPAPGARWNMRCRQF